MLETCAVLQCERLYQEIIKEAQEKLGADQPVTNKVIWASFSIVLSLVDRSVARWVGRSLDRSVGRSLARSLARSVGGSVARFVGRSVARWVGRLVGPSVSRSVGRSLGG